MHNWNTFNVRTSHEQIRTHKTHHSPNSGEVTTFPLIIYYVPLHEAHIQMAFCPGGVLKFSQLGLPRLWGPIILHATLHLEWNLKQSCSPSRKLSNSMSHATYTRKNQGDSWLLVVRSQIANLTPIPSFGHNLCFKCPNGSCEPILNIFVPRAFHWYKEFFNTLGFAPAIAL
jgi:hypothetical protein